jgi:ubiquinone biosynthesis monooxygenase Coq7
MQDLSKIDKNHIKNNILSLLPGKNTPHSLKTEMLRVDHAGELGAIHIYRGQIDVLSYISKKDHVTSQIQEMYTQEVVHLNKFNQVLPKRQIRPSAFTPLWQIGGYMLGAITMLISSKSAMACTESVETVIDNHYEKQINFFNQERIIDPLITDLQQFQQDELAHKHEAIENNAHQAPFYNITTSLISILCYSAIKIAHKI